MKRMSWNKRLAIASLTLLPALAAGFATEAAAYGAVVVYGDSLSDNGNLFAATTALGNPYPVAPYYQGRRSDGPLAVEGLAAALDVPLIDYAWIGATTGIGNYADGGSVTGLGAYNLPGMTTVFDATRHLLAPLVANDSLFVVWAGPNDLLAPAPGDTPSDTVQRAVANELALIASLQALGVNHILAPGMPDLGLTPYFRSLPGGAASGTQLTDGFNALLLAGLPQDVLFFDTAALLRAVVAEPGYYGFDNVTDPCFTATSLCANPQDYLFFDDFHPTAATHTLLADRFLAVVPEPASLMLTGVALAGLALSRRRTIACAA
jgi:phospholipase/lecithinase/hemolysin